MSIYNIDAPRAAMTFFHAGRYTVGAEDGAEAERPLREIDIEAFWLDQTLVTNAQFALFVAQSGYITQAEENGCSWGWRDQTFQMLEGLSWRSYSLTGRETHPVILVSWNDAKAYANWVGKRLPTEWEWEIAASGASASRYPWGDAEPKAGNCNWHKTPASPPPTVPVQTFPANKVGLFEMVGNIWQWCDNTFDNNEDELRARRGGAWNVIQDFRLRCANRGALRADSAAPNMGFRCAVSY